MPINSTDKNGNQNTVYLGYWDAAAESDGSTPVGKFVFDRVATVVNNRWEGEEDITPFSFTPQEYLDAWDDNLDSGDGYQVWRNFGLTEEDKVMRLKAMLWLLQMENLSEEE